MKKIIFLLLLITLDLCIAHAQKAIDFYSRGIRKTNLRDYKGAKIDFEKAIELDPNYAYAHNNLALILSHNFNDREGAKEHYNKAISINPNDPITHYNYAILLRDVYKDKENSKLQFEKAIKLNPRFAAAQYNYAILLKDNFGEKEKELAKQHYMIATGLNPKLVNPNFDVDFEIIRTKIEKF